jgi:sulfur carrier protein ThiS
MYITVKTSQGIKKLKLAKGATVEDSLRALALPRCKHITLRQGVPIPADERLRDGDLIDVVSVFSGG